MNSRADMRTIQSIAIKDTQDYITPAHQENITVRLFWKSLIKSLKGKRNHDRNK